MTGADCQTQKNVLDLKNAFDNNNDNNKTVNCTYSLHDLHSNSDIVSRWLMPSFDARSRACLMATKRECSLSRIYICLDFAIWIGVTTEYPNTSSPFLREVATRYAVCKFQDA